MIDRLLRKLKSIRRVGTHNGIFHSDDVGAYALICAVMKLLGLEPPSLLTRSRDPNALLECDVVFDVMGAWDEEGCVFDHHQTEGLPVRECGILYSSFGLVFKWLSPVLKYYGMTAEALAEFERDLVLPIDAGDNGQDLVGEHTFNQDDRPVQPYVLQRVISGFVPRWDEDADMDQRFLEAAGLMESIIRRKIDACMAGIKAKEIVDDVINLAGIDAKVLDFGRGFLPWQKPVLESGSEALFVLFFDNPSGSWRVQAVPKQLGSFENRAKLPQKDELPEDSRIADGLSFVHKAGFIAGGTKESCMALAEYAIGQL
jgi:uncharacterized UPF0160 family protein